MILATICCRGGSKGVPGKNIRLLKGKPLIAYTIEAAKDSLHINNLIISTDDASIASIAKQFGASVPFMRPADLATDTASKWPVFIHAVETYEKLSGETVDYLVDLDVTVPLKKAQDIDGAIELALTDPTADVVITAYEPERNPYFNMMEVNNEGYAEIVKKGERPIVRRQDAPLVYSLTPAAYVVKKSALYQYEHWSKAKCKIFPIPRERAVDIDTEIDFKIVEFLMDHYQ
ncbi:acylneuraminate cytidylyltransferase family protein [Segetibacter sp.]|jgi:CMP-N,N'-diacetyllegionaminic acid synthase|uniref:acylneuraminate cytidylyltransferase family protein n=1 Tax=Segetibacter sp. TaxID=2231182 RepID=UPI00261F6043|nr:acylneuraminate cytidylyltransferase family protein [Segetibacter sp.]MCW3078875.1 Acylneuraminate cytidylyltransferase [Segetibacter sp.]